MSNHPYSPLPWREGACASIVCENPANQDPQSEETRSFYGGDPVCESLQAADRKRILEAVSAYFPVSCTPQDLPAQYAALERCKRALETRLDAVKDEMAALESRILEAWADAGQTQARIGNLTLYVATDFFCTKRAGVDTGVLCETLEANGLGNVVSQTYNSSSLKAWIKEQRNANADIPQDLADMLNMTEVPRLRARKV